MVSQTSCPIWCLSALTVPFPISWHAVCWGSFCRAILDWVGFSSCTTCPMVEQSQGGTTLPQAQDCNLVSGAAGPHTLVQMIQARADPHMLTEASWSFSCHVYWCLSRFSAIFSPRCKAPTSPPFSMKNPWVTTLLWFFFLLESSRKFFFCLFSF